MVIFNTIQLLFSFGGVLLLLVDFNFWWSFLLVDFILPTASALPNGGDLFFLLLLLLCSPVCCVGALFVASSVHTATQPSRLKSLTC